MTYNQENQKITARWIRYCNAQGLQREAQAVRLGIEQFDYNLMIQDKRAFPDNSIEKMMRIMEGRDLLDTTVLHTALYNDLEKAIIRCKNEKIMMTLASPTGQGKTTSGKKLAKDYSCKYIQVLTDQEKSKVAAKKNFIRDICTLFNINEKSTNNLRHLIAALQSDTKVVLIIDEAQRLISEDWGYFKVLQDLLDNVPQFSILLLGNYKFYNDVFTDSDRTYQGISEQEQFLRRISVVRKLPKLQKSDVKLWADYNNIPLKPTDHQALAEFFSQRAGLSDLEEVRKEIIHVMGKGRIKSFNDVDASTIITMYKGIHTKIKENYEDGSKEEDGEKNYLQNINANRQAV
jgi:hypothetical protein